MLRNLFKVVLKNWKSYKYRFIPWVAWNLRKQRTVRNVQSEEDIGIVQEKAVSTLENLFQDFYDESVGCHQKSDYIAPVGELGGESTTQRNAQIMKRHLGFCIGKRRSRVSSGGMGVFVTEGSIGKGQLAALYPGTVYYPSDPLFFQSFANPFILKCIDGVYVDGNNKRISKSIYKSCVYRDAVGPFRVADLSWLTDEPQNPLAIGQFVNNQTKELECNVTYREYDVSKSFPLHLRTYLPNINYRPVVQDLPLVRVVGLLALRDIQKGEELLSSYYTIVVH